MAEEISKDSTTTADEQMSTSPKGVESTAPTQTEVGSTSSTLKEDRPTTITPTLYDPAATTTLEVDGQLETITTKVDSTMSTTARGK